VPANLLTLSNLKLLVFANSKSATNPYLGSLKLRSLGSVFAKSIFNDVFPRPYGFLNSSIPGSGRHTKSLNSGVGIRVNPIA
jgi:hypothetical protein